MRYILSLIFLCFINRGFAQSTSDSEPSTKWSFAPAFSGLNAEASTIFPFLFGFNAGVTADYDMFRKSDSIRHAIGLRFKGESIADVRTGGDSQENLFSTRAASALIRYSKVDKNDILSFYLGIISSTNRINRLRARPTLLAGGEIKFVLKNGFSAFRIGGDVLYLPRDPLEGHSVSGFILSLGFCVGLMN